MRSFFVPPWHSCGKLRGRQHHILYRFKILYFLIKLENAAETLLQWFKDNRMKANPDKYHLLINNTKKSFQIKIDNETVSKYEKQIWKVAGG